MVRTNILQWGGEGFRQIVRTMHMRVQQHVSSLSFSYITTMYNSKRHVVVVAAVVVHKLNKEWISALIELIIFVLIILLSTVLTDNCSNCIIITLIISSNRIDD